MDIIDILVNKRHELNENWTKNVVNKLTDGVVPSPDTEKEEETVGKLEEEFEDEEKDDFERDETSDRDEPGDKPEPPSDDEIQEPEDDEDSESEGDEQEKEYLGNTDDTHFYLYRSEKDEEGEGDLQIVDQEGKVLYSAKKNEVDPSDVLAFLIKAKDEMEPPIENVSIDVFDRYVVPALEEEEEEQMEEEGEDMVDSDEEGGAGGERPMEDEEVDREFESKQNKSTLQEVKVVFMNREFTANLVESDPGITIDVNNKKFKFSPEFSQHYKDKDGKVSEENLKELALDALANIDDSEFDKLAATAGHSDKEIEDSVEVEDEQKEVNEEEEPVEEAIPSAKKAFPGAVDLKKILKGKGTKEEKLDKMKKELKKNESEETNEENNMNKETIKEDEVKEELTVETIQKQIADLQAKLAEMQKANEDADKEEVTEEAEQEEQTDEVVEETDDDKEVEESTSGKKMPKMKKLGKQKEGKDAEHYSDSEETVISKLNELVGEEDLQLTRDMIGSFLPKPDKVEQAERTSDITGQKESQIDY